MVISILISEEILDEHKGDKGENLPNTTILVTPLENVGKDSSDSTNENWDSTGWDCMENSENTSFSSNNPSVGKLSMTTLPVDAEDGWDTSEWGCIEDEPEIDKKSDDNLNNWSSGKWTEGDSDRTEKHSSDDIIEDNSNISEKRKLQKQRKPACKKEIRGPLKLGQKIQ
ncbi:protein SDA1 homolog [Ctenocephalides felis]|uniref:protein SDA1 homolog n=1 Tax=Ctenocephalides felis TaxID=7515 RepID=UPI000E6E35DC|nr:protein SDA1 homolog [Ctenocephalides felis]